MESRQSLGLVQIQILALGGEAGVGALTWLKEAGVEVRTLIIFLGGVAHKYIGDQSVLRHRGQEIVISGI